MPAVPTVMSQSRSSASYAYVFVVDPCFSSTRLLTASYLYVVTTAPAVIFVRRFSSSYSYQVIDPFASLTDSRLPALSYPYSNRSINVLSDFFVSTLVSRLVAFQVFVVTMPFA